MRKLLEANNEIKIICYKAPSIIHKVNYDQIVNELWETDLAKDDKHIGNITVRTLEKSHNTAQKSYCLNTLREACHCQRSLEEGFMHLCNTTRNSKKEDTSMGNTYILNITSRNKLVSGFRYIKELLLHYHNFSMYESCNTVVENAITVY